MLQTLREQALQCNLCKLSATRTKVVFGEGSESARIMFIGEGPGKDEDLTGRPFVGRAGELLTRIIENGMKLKRSDVYIANVVKCRPTVDMLFKKDRPPDDEEVKACSQYLEKQIELIAPAAIVTLGNPSTRFLLNTKAGITGLRGKWFDYKGIPVMPTFHPSFVLRNGGDSSEIKKLVWHDIQLVMKRVGLA